MLLSTRLRRWTYVQLPVGTAAPGAKNRRMTASPSQRITAEVTAWAGVDAGPGRRGELAFRVGRREIGHLHGDRAAHFFFPKDVWAELFAAGRVAYHPVFPAKPGPAARRIEDDADVEDVIALMRLNYDRITAARRDAA
jgi:Family of unknown function (DUF5519)